ncbi:MAG: undecaprenyl/decaprenyl-phosphate alpha-N-acetylglucosaminyl 1-phosphate transferase [Bacteroidales bacterium]|nr:undecaprenyl/decaprenyl-phosphate alpha-N-acetylglucosaminyl 1-phosphate transferase [Bacteroidales bacterium]
MDNFSWIALFSVLGATLTSGIIVLWTIPTINYIARTKGLLNAPGERTSHRYKTPNLAGISIFFGTIVSCLFFIHSDLDIFRIVYLASIIIFFAGLKDDILILTPWKKLLAQFVVATLIVMADVRFTQIFELFGIDQFGEIVSFVITIVFIVGIINAVNLIDGIDGLVASVGTLILGCFGLFFFINGIYTWAIYCAGMIGALIAFFQYNVFGLRNKTFMGDSGSLLLGLSIAVTTIIFWEANADKSLPLTFVGAPAITLAIIIVPVFDMARVFAYRIIRGLSPFSADRNHIHHRIVDMGFTHLQTSLIILGLNMLAIAVALLLDLFLGPLWIIAAISALTFLFVLAMNKVYKKKKKMMGGGVNS